MQREAAGGPTRPFVLVGVDGSPQSAAAVVWAAAEAADRGAELLVVHVVDTTFLGVWGASRGLRTELRSLAEPMLRSALRLAADTVPTGARRGRVLLGPATRTLLVLARHAELTVVGRSGRGALDRVWLGSLTQRLLVHGEGPIVVVPPDGVDATRLTGVVVGVDELSAPPSVLRFAFELARRRGVPLRGVRALAERLPYRAVDERPIAQYLGAWPAQYPDVACSIVTHSGPPGIVLAEACTTGDLLALGRHRRAPLEPPHIGDVVAAALAAAPCPVAVVPA